MKSTSRRQWLALFLLIFVQGLIFWPTAAVFAQTWEELHRQAFQCYKAKEYQDASTVCIQALKTAEVMASKDRRKVASSLRLMGMIYSAQEKYSDAEPYLEKALTIDHSDKPDTFSMLIGVYEKQGKQAEADKLNDKADMLWGSDGVSVESVELVPPLEPGNDSPPAIEREPQDSQPKTAKPLSPRLENLLSYGPHGLHDMDEKHLYSYVQDLTEELSLFRRDALEEDLPTMERIQKQVKLVRSVLNERSESLKAKKHQRQETAKTSIRDTKQPAYEILKWYSFYDGSMNCRCVKVKVKCNNLSDLLDNRNFGAVLADNRKVKASSGSFDMLRTHEGQVYNGSVCFGNTSAPIDSVYYTDRLHYVD